MKPRFLDKEDELSKELRASFPGLLENFPQRRYLSRIRHFNPFRPLHLPLAATEMLDGLQASHGIRAVALFQKAALCRLAIEALERLDRGELPQEIEPLQRAWLEQVYADCTQQPDSYYDHRKMFWPLRKDIAVCSGHAIPVGGAWLVAKSRLSRRALVDQHPPGRQEDRGPFRTAKRALMVEALDRIGIKDALKRARQAAHELMGSYDWFYEIHTVERNIRAFNAEQMHLSYGRIARLLERNPGVWGVFRESWFLDPALAEISPELRFLWEVPQRYGAELHCAGPCAAEDIPKITATSAIRRKLYREGRYVPQSYFYFWPREHLIRMVGASRRRAAADEFRPVMPLPNPHGG